VDRRSVRREDRDAVEESEVFARRRVMNGGGNALGAHNHLEEGGRWSMVVVHWCVRSDVQAL